jgi:hypothetical protein
MDIASKSPYQLGIRQKGLDNQIICVWDGLGLKRNSNALSLFDKAFDP